MKKRILISFLFYVFYLPLVADELAEGQWSGVYTSYHGSSLNAEYYVSNVRENNENRVKIKMILDLQPRAEYTYELENITLRDKKLSFNIKKQNETKTCELELLDNNQYVGLCRSSADPDPEGKWLAGILMIPPVSSGSEE